MRAFRARTCADLSQQEEERPVGFEDGSTRAFEQHHGCGRKTCPVRNKVGARCGALGVCGGVCVGHMVCVGGCVDCGWSEVGCV